MRLTAIIGLVRHVKEDPQPAGKVWFLSGTNRVAQKHHLAGLIRRFRNCADDVAPLTLRISCIAIGTAPRDRPNHVAGRTPPSMPVPTHARLKPDPPTVFARLKPLSQSLNTTSSPPQTSVI